MRSRFTLPASTFLNLTAINYSVSVAINEKTFLRQINAGKAETFRHCVRIYSLKKALGDLSLKMDSLHGAKICPLPLPLPFLLLSQSSSVAHWSSCLCISQLVHLAHLEEQKSAAQDKNSGLIAQNQWLENKVHFLSSLVVMQGPKVMNLRFSFFDGRKSCSLLLWSYLLTAWFFVIDASSTSLNGRRWTPIRPKFRPLEGDPLYGEPKVKKLLVIEAWQAYNNEKWMPRNRIAKWRIAIYFEKANLFFFTPP